MGGQLSKTEVVNQPIKASELQTYIMVINIKLTQQRNKKVFDIKKKKDEVINCLRDYNVDMARIKVEGILRNEDYISACDVLATLCEIIKEKTTYMLSNSSCPDDIRAPVETLIFASSRLEIDELHKFTDIVKRKYGEIFVSEANNNKNGLVNKNIEKQLTVLPYNKIVLTTRLKMIAGEEKIQVDFPEDVIVPITDFSNPFSNDNMATPYPINSQPYLLNNNFDVQQGDFNHYQFHTPNYNPNTDQNYNFVNFNENGNEQMNYGYNMNTQNMNNQNMNNQNMNTQNMNTQNMNNQNMNSQKINNQNMNYNNHFQEQVDENNFPTPKKY